MQTYSFVVSLRIWHPFIDPDDISSKLSVQPSAHFRAGERRQTPKGQLLDGNWPESYWNADLLSYGECLSHNRTIETVVADYIETLRPHQPFLLQLRTDGGRVLIQASSHSKRNYALEFSPDMLSALCSLGVGFAHDVYPYPQNW